MSQTPDFISTVVGAQSAAPTIDAIPGYRVVRELGRGGGGVVYEAEDQRLGRLVAIKTLRSGFDISDVLHVRFLEEIRAIARLDHAHIVKLFTDGDFAGVPFFTMELLSGGTLAEKIAGKPLAPRMAAELALTITEAANHAHKAGIIHRDLKPHNVLFSSDGVLKVTDFGLARWLEDGRDVTQSAEIRGTPGYMSPEQASGTTSRIDPRTDIYAIGVILYEMITGRLPFQAPTVVQIVMMIMAMDPVAPRTLQPEVPKDLETICLKCLQKDPDRRYPTATALAADLQAFLDGRPISARPVSRAERAARWIRRHPTYSSVAGLSALGLLATLLGLLFLVQRERGHSVQLAGERDKARVERDRAEDNFRTSLQAYRMLLADVAKLGENQWAGPNEEKQVQHVTEFFGRLLQDDPHNVEYRFLLAQAWHYRGRIPHDNAGVHNAAPDLVQMAYERSIELFGELTTDPAHGEESQIMRANTLQNLGNFHRGRQEWMPALNRYEQASLALQELCQLYPDKRVYKLFLANAEGNRGRCEMLQQIESWKQQNATLADRKRLLAPARTRLRTSLDQYRKQFQEVPDLRDRFHGNLDKDYRTYVDIAELEQDPMFVRTAIAEWMTEHGGWWPSRFEAARRMTRLHVVTQDEADAARAIEWLSLLKTEGFFGLPGREKELRNDSTFQPLRQRADYKKLFPAPGSS